MRLRLIDGSSLDRIAEDEEKTRDGLLSKSLRQKRRRGFTNASDASERPQDYKARFRRGGS